jgi:F0F1-type ATP synthase assembly protein I
MWRAALRLSAIGLEMGVAVGVGYAIGAWIDGKYGTKPYWTLGMLLLGIATAFRALVRVAREVNLDDDDADDADGQEKPEDRRGIQRKEDRDQQR